MINKQLKHIGVENIENESTRLNNNNFLHGNLTLVLFHESEI